MSRATKLLEQLDALNMSQNDLAEKTGLTKQTISKFRKGSKIRLDTLEKICDVLDVDISYFSQGESNTVEEDPVEYHPAPTVYLDTKHLNHFLNDIKKRVNKLEHEVSILKTM